MAKICDHTSVGMIVRKGEKILLIERGRPPYGFAIPAGHVDEDKSFEDAAIRELEEEVGLKTDSLKLLIEGRRENKCGREDGSWHFWKIYEVKPKSFDLKRSLEETKRADWYDLDQIKQLAGHEVLIPLLDNELPEEFGGDRKIYFGKYIEDNGGMEAFPPEHKLWDLKRNAINDHFEKIKQGDAIIVANHNKRGIAGYIGGNTLIEMGLAFYLKKPIYVLNSISDELSYKQEIYGMSPVLLNGNLNLI